MKMMPLTAFAHSIIKDVEILKKYGLDDRTIKAIQLRFGVIDGIEHTFRFIGSQLYSHHNSYKCSENKPSISYNTASVIIGKGLRKLEKMSKQPIFIK